MQLSSVFTNVSTLRPKYSRHRHATYSRRRHAKYSRHRHAATHPPLGVFSLLQKVKFRTNAKQQTWCSYVCFNLHVLSSRRSSLNSLMKFRIS
jgi:hypothetical protein